MVEIRVTGIGRLGDGVADGPIFVPRALPGETVSGEVRGAELVDVRIIEPSSDRVRPVCRHFKACGGCQMQHATDGFVAAWKRDLVDDAVKAQGISASFRPVETSPPRSRRRAKLAAKRTKSGAIAGFHGRASDTVVDVQECPLLDDRLAAGALPLARELAIQGASRKAALSVQCTLSRDGLDVAVSGGKPLDEEMRAVLPGIAAAHDVARLTWDAELVAQSAPPRHQIGNAVVSLPPGAFLQATDHGEAVLQAAVMEATEGCHEVVDLFAGCGTFALCLADRGPVTAVEGEKPMARALQEAANTGALAYPVKSLTRDLFHDPLVAPELNRFDAVVLDPPRAGAAAQVEQIAQSDVAVVAYVSCDPGSFARDAAVLVRGGFQVEWVQVVDQFRWSAHVEVAARFFREV